MGRAGWAVVLVYGALAGCAGEGDGDEPVDSAAGLPDTADTDPGVVETGADSDTDPTGESADTGDTGPTDDTDGPYGPGVIASGVLPCADPSVRAATPFLPWAGGPDWQDQPVDTASEERFAGAGLGVGDLDGDGWRDLVVSDAPEDGLQLWMGGPGGTLTDRSDLLPPTPAKTSGATLVDVDDDGDLDIHVTVYARKDLVLINDLPAPFVDEAATLGLQGDTGHFSMSSAWGDVDGDGDLDAFVAGYGKTFGDFGRPPGQPNRLYRNDGGLFVDVASTMFAPDHPFLTGHTFLGAWVDANLDDRPELYLLNDFGWDVPPLLLPNAGGVLGDPLDVGLDLPAENMGLGLGDLNGDRRPDFLVTAWDLPGLYVSRGSQWFQEDGPRGLSWDTTRGQYVAWGNELADLDHDGDLDAVVAFGHLWFAGEGNPFRQPDAVFLQDTDGTFDDVAPDWGVDHDGWSRTVAAVDLDGDGWLELVRTDLRGPTRIDRATCGDGAWIEVSLRQPPPNVFAVGAKVTVEDGGDVFATEIRAGGTSYVYGGPPVAHLGLGARDVVDRLVVRWPDGTERVLRDVETRQFLQIRR